MWIYRNISKIYIIHRFLCFVPPTLYQEHRTKPLSLHYLYHCHHTKPTTFQHREGGMLRQLYHLNSLEMAPTISAFVLVYIIGCPPILPQRSPTMTKNNQLFLLAMLQKARMSSNSAVKNNITSITTRPHTKTLHSRYINDYVAMPIDTNLDNMIVLRANWAAFLLKLTVVLMQACCPKISLHELRNRIWERKVICSKRQMQRCASKKLPSLKEEPSTASSPGKHLSSTSMHYLTMLALTAAVDMSALQVVMLRSTSH